MNRDAIGHITLAVSYNLREIIPTWHFANLSGTNGSGSTSITFLKICLGIAIRKIINFGWRNICLTNEDIPCLLSNPKCYTVFRTVCQYTLFWVSLIPNTTFKVPFNNILLVTPIYAKHCLWFTYTDWNSYEIFIALVCATWPPVISLDLIK